VSDVVEEKTEEAFGEGRRRGEGGEGRGPLAEGDKRSFEAEAVEGNLIKKCRLKHGGANKIVSDEVHGEFAINHGRGAASEDVHSHGSLDVPEKEFGEPALKVELGKGGRGEGLGVEEGGDDRNGTGSRTGESHGVGDLAESEEIRKGSPRV